MKYDIAVLSTYNIKEKISFCVNLIPSDNAAKIQYEFRYLLRKMRYNNYNANVYANSYSDTDTFCISVFYVSSVLSYPFTFPRNAHTAAV